MKIKVFTCILIAFLAGNLVQGQPFKEGYYTTSNMGVDHIVSFKNGEIHIIAGMEIAIYKPAEGKYRLAGWHYGNPANMQTPKSKAGIWIERVSTESYRYYAGGASESEKKLYRFHAAKTAAMNQESETDEPIESNDSPYNIHKLENRNPKSAHVDIGLERVEEIAPHWEKYMSLSKSDPDNSPVWLQAAHAAIIASSYRQNPDMMNTLLKQKATLIQKMAPGKPNPCPDVIPKEIWDSVE